MRYLTTYIASPSNNSAAPEKQAAIARFAEDLSKSGILLETGGMMPLEARIRQVGDKFTVTDGPFPETKELIVGYAILQVRDKEEALEVARRFMKIAGDGEGEVRQLVGPQDEPQHR